MRDHDTQGFETPRRGTYTPLWFMAGAFVGAAAALLLAPTSGRETRAYVGRRSREAAEGLRERGRETADGFRERGREAMHEAADCGRQLWQEHGEPIVSAMKQEYEHVAGRNTGPKANGSVAGPTA
ncbi:MAG: YtxH domain-containing protein [Vicinamibacterales bacterium]